MHTVKLKMSYRIPNLENKTGFSWHKQGYVTVIGKTAEDVVNQAYRLPAPDDVNVGAIHYRGVIEMGLGPGRQNLIIDVLKTF